jgi:hypothetical protein
VNLRVVLAVVAAAVMCALGALILGEYEFSGAMPLGAGLLFGLVVSEIVIEIAARRHPVLGVVSALLVAGALAWAGRISSGEGLRPFPNGAWVAMACGALAAGLRTGWPVRPAPAGAADEITEPG